MVSATSNQKYNELLLTANRQMRKTQALENDFLTLIKQSNTMTPAAKAALKAYNNRNKTLAKKTKQGIINPVSKHLENCKEETACKKDSLTMAKKCKVQLKLCNGQSLWVTASSTNKLAQGIYDKVYSQTITDKQAPLFEDIAAKWYNIKWKPKEKSNTNTWKDVHNYVYNHAIPYFKGKTIAEIKLSDIQLYINHLRQNTNVKATSSLKKALLYIKNIFELATDDGIISRNPAGQLKKFDTTGEKKTRTAMTAIAVEKMLENIETLPIADSILIYIPLYTGVRRGEMLGLKWEDIDWNKNLISVKRAVHFENSAPKLGKTKSAAGIRAIPLRHELRALLEPIRGEDSHYIVSGEKPMTECKFRRTWQRIERKADICGAKPHVLRHTFATFAADHMQPKDLQGILGHSSASTTMDVYTHVRQDKVAHLMEDVETLYKP